MAQTNHTQHCKLILELLQTGRKIYASELAEISRNHTARISQLRNDGWDIRCTFENGRDASYRLHGRSNDSVQRTIANSESVSPKPLHVSVARHGEVIRTFVTSVPEPVQYGFRFTIPGTVRLEPGDMLTIEVNHSPAISQAAAA